MDRHNLYWGKQKTRWVCENNQDSNNVSITLCWSAKGMSNRKYVNMSIHQKKIRQLQVKCMVLNHASFFSSPWVLFYSPLTLNGIYFWSLTRSNLIFGWYLESLHSCVPVPISSLAHKHEKCATSLAVSLKLCHLIAPVWMSDTECQTECCHIVDFFSVIFCYLFIYFFWCQLSSCSDFEYQTIESLSHFHVLFY